MFLQLPQHILVHACSTLQDAIYHCVYSLQSIHIRISDCTRIHKRDFHERLSVGIVRISMHMRGFSQILAKTPSRPPGGITINTLYKFVLTIFFKYYNSNTTILSYFYY